MNECAVSRHEIFSLSCFTGNEENVSVRKRASVRWSRNKRFSGFCSSACSSVAFRAGSSLGVFPPAQIRRGLRASGPYATSLNASSNGETALCTAVNFSATVLMSSSCHGGTSVICRFFPESHRTGSFSWKLSQRKNSSWRSLGMPIATKIRCFMKMEGAFARRKSSLLDFQSVERPDKLDCYVEFELHKLWGVEKIDAYREDARVSFRLQSGP